MSASAAENIILETQRTFLRPLRQTDFADLAEILQDPAVMYAYEHAFDDREVQQWLDRQLQRYDKDGFGLWAVISKETGGFIGQVGLTRQETPRGTETEIVWLLKKSCWHQGFATKAGEGCRQYAFNVLKKQKVVSIIRDTNLASRKVAERLGMRPAFSFVKHYYGINMPHIVYAVTTP